MIQALNRSASPFLRVEGSPPRGQSLLDKVCKAVSDFFKNIVLRIKGWIEEIRNFFKTKPATASAQGIANSTVTTVATAQLNTGPASAAAAAEENVPAATKDRISLYNNTPMDDKNFLRRAIAIHRMVLGDENLEALNAFNQQLADSDAEVMPIVLMLAIRNFLFTNIEINFDNCPKFLRKPYTKSAMIDGARFDEDRNTFYDIEELKKLFLPTLPSREKLIILNATDPSGIDQYPISENAKTVLRGITAVTNELIQKNDAFAEAFLAQ
ncbi:MAG: hypothetical protein V4487_05730 [Chlamydiota bacterium]